MKKKRGGYGVQLKIYFDKNFILVPALCVGMKKESSIGIGAHPEHGNQEK